MFKPYYFERTYFSMDDVYQGYYENIPGIAGKGPAGFHTTGVHDCYVFIDNILSAVGYTRLNAVATITASKYLNICWKEYIWPKFYNRAVCFTDEQLTDDEEANKQLMYQSFADSVGPIIAWLKESDTKYSLLIKNQEANKDKLLGQIRSSSTQHFNDTPQNQGEFEDDAHNTNVTKSESTTDGGTLLSRLNEIEDNLKRLYEDWSNEFRKFIFWSV